MPGPAGSMTISKRFSPRNAGAGLQATMYVANLAHQRSRSKPTKRLGASVTTQAVAEMLVSFSEKWRRHRRERMFGS